jgi:dUTP pyrophosphatase
MVQYWDPEEAKYFPDDAVRVLVNDGASYLGLPAYPGDCGLDLVAAEDTVIYEGQTANIACGVSVALPLGTFGWIVARSSTWTKHGLMVIPGIIDSGWRGELRTLVYRPPQPRTNEWEHKIPVGTRLAQLIILPNLMDQVKLVAVDSLPPSERGTRGFGSSG